MMRPVANDLRMVCLRGPGRLFTVEPTKDAADCEDKRLLAATDVDASTLLEEVDRRLAPVPTLPVAGIGHTNIVRVAVTSNLPLIGAWNGPNNNAARYATGSVPCGARWLVRVPTSRVIPIGRRADLNLWVNSSLYLGPFPELAERHAGSDGTIN